MNTKEQHKYCQIFNKSAVWSYDKDKWFYNNYPYYLLFYLQHTQKLIKKMFEKENRLVILIDILLNRKLKCPYCKKKVLDYKSKSIRFAWDGTNPPYFYCEICKTTWIKYE